MEKVRAKMKCTSITKTGDSKKPSMQIQMGAVYSSDPESENRSFAQATPSASVSMNIDAGMPAALFFELGGEYYVDFTAAGVPERQYVKDTIWYIPTGPIVLSARDSSNPTDAVWNYEKRTITIGDREIRDFDTLVKEGLTHWRHRHDQ